MHFWANFQYAGSALAPALWLLFIASYLKRDRWVTSGRLFLFAIEPLMVNAVVWTNGGHGRFYVSLELAHQGAYSFLRHVYGPLYWVHAAYSYALILAATILLIHALFGSPRLQQRQFWSVLWGAVLPWIGMSFYLFHVSWVDFVPFAFTVSCAVFASGSTYRKLAEDARTESEQRFLSLMESAPVGVVLFDDKGVIRYTNLELERMCGYTRGELLGATLEAILPQRFQEEYRKYSASYLAEPKPRPMGIGLDLYARRKNGSEFPVDVGLNAVEVGNERIVTTFMADATERKKAELSQKEYEKWLQEANDKLERGVIERTRQLEEAQSELLSQQRLKQEIDLAAQVQQSLLPRRLPSPEGYSFDAAAFPARIVSGDFYDFSTPEQRVHTIALGDISGKGISAALLTSTARTLFRVESAHEISPARILTKVNAALHEDLSQTEVFVTMLVMRLEEDSGRLIASNAGSCRPLVYRNLTGACEEMETSGLPIGIFSTGEWEDEQTVLLPGDAVVLYSDGISEAQDPAEKLFGAERLRNIVCAYGRKTASLIKTSILDEVERFRGGAPLSDDVTLIVLKALPRRVISSFDLSMETLEDVVAFVPKTVASYGEKFTGEIELAASEIVTNILRHGYQGTRGAVRLEIGLLPEGVTIDFFDDGLPFDVDSVHAPDLDLIPEGGYGLHIIRRCTDELSHENGVRCSNHWRISKRVASAGKQAQGIEPDE